MPKNYVLIDLENVQPSNLKILASHSFKAIVFVGSNRKEISNVIELVKKETEISPTELARLELKLKKAMKDTLITDKITSKKFNEWMEKLEDVVAGEEEIVVVILGKAAKKKKIKSEVKRLDCLSNIEAKKYFLKSTSYFNADLPAYISFHALLKGVSKVLRNESYSAFKSSNPNDCFDVNYNFITNKDGRLAWRALELMHPAIYVSLLNVICRKNNWKLIVERLNDFKGGIVECCSFPVVSLGDQTDKAEQITSWWERVEQKSIVHSLEYTHILHTDVTNCYGSLYTHSISWALHEKKYAKKNTRNKSLLGNKIDAHIRAGRYGQTNGISQGSALMDFIAEIVLGYVDKLIDDKLNEGGDKEDVKILRYRDDYRIFANSKEAAERILRIISDKLRDVGMVLGSAKTISYSNVVEGSIKPDKLAGISLNDLGTTNAKTIQKQLLRLHSFGQKFPNSGALRRLVGEFHSNIIQQRIEPKDIKVQVAIATDIAFISPATFPAVAAILSHLISLVDNQEKKLDLWDKIHKKMSQVPNNGYLQIWLQRVTKPKAVNIKFKNDENICQIVNKKPAKLWNNDWISSAALRAALDPSMILVSKAEDMEQVMQPEEIELFIKNATHY